MSRTAVVTGAASPRGIGRATALLLAEKGWNIGILDIDLAGSRALADEITEKYDVKTYAVAADVSNESQVRTAIDELEAALPPLAALANIAGVSSPVPYLELTSDEWHRVININLNGVHYVTRRVAESMVRHGYGRIVSVSSTSAQRGGGTYSKTPYSVAKAGVIGLTRALARELGPHGITVNDVAPGAIDTIKNDASHPHVTKLGAPDENSRGEVINRIPVGRLGTPEDLAYACGFLASPRAGFITGTVLPVFGGQWNVG